MTVKSRGKGNRKRRIIVPPLDGKQPKGTEDNRKARRQADSEKKQPQPD